MKSGTGVATVNNRDITEYFGGETIWKEESLQPLMLLKQEGLFDLKITVSGGGIRGQAGAISLGLARALDFYAQKHAPEHLLTQNEEEGGEADSDDTGSSVLGLEKWHGAIRKAGFLTRNSKRVLRKKVGLVKARKAKQFSKR